MISTESRRLCGTTVGEADIENADKGRSTMVAKRRTTSVFQRPKEKSTAAGVL
jgi:hypothetical protein